MNRCATKIGSTTAKWLAAVNRLYSTSQRSSEDESAKLLELLSRFKGPSTAVKYKLITTDQDGQNSKASREAFEQESQATPDPFKQEFPAPIHEQHPYSPTTYMNAAASTPDANIHGTPTAPFERRALPLSPLMNPAVIASKQKHIAPKARRSKNPDGLQRILAKNPYALALATPVRRCQLTLTALPSFFLQDFNLMEHPETGVPWYLPRSLTNKHAPAISQNQRALHSPPGEELELVNETQQGSQSKQIGGELTPKIGYTVYTLSNQLALRAMQDEAGYARNQSSRSIRRAVRRGLPPPGANAHTRFVPERFRQVKAAHDIVSKFSWRSDMHDFVLKLMRRRTVEDLVHVIGLKRGYVVGCNGWEDAMAKPQVGAFLWTGGNGDREMNIPPEFATLDKSTQLEITRKVPVHNLRALLGREKLAELREKLPSGIFENEVLVLRHKTATVNVQMRLWKLQGYSAEYREFAGRGEEQEMVDDSGEEEDDLDESEPNEEKEEDES